MKNKTLCKRCKKNYWSTKIQGDYPALSRRDNKVWICSECGQAEAMFDFWYSSTSESFKKSLKVAKEEESAWLHNNNSKKLK
jgi:ribosomal protein L37AE/L43A